MQKEETLKEKLLKELNKRLQVSTEQLLKAKRDQNYAASIAHLEVKRIIEDLIKLIQDA